MTDQVIVQRENVNTGQRFTAETFADITTVPYVDAVWVDAGLKFEFDGTLTDDEKQAIKMRVKSGDPAADALVTQAVSVRPNNDAFEALYAVLPNFDTITFDELKLVVRDVLVQSLALTRQASGFIDLNSLPEPTVDPGEIV